MKFITLVITMMVFFACHPPGDRIIVGHPVTAAAETDTIPVTIPGQVVKVSNKKDSLMDIAGVTGRALVDFAKTLQGTPYKYAMSDPLVGFDCSGFITYVFNDFSIDVPRSSVDFTNLGREVDVATAKTGDLILFTGTVDSIRIVGHMGIVTENMDSLRFIHATSGKANAVTVTSLNEHYKKRFVKVIRVLAD